MDTHAIIVRAGPAGLTVATELALADDRPERRGHFTGLPLDYTALGTRYPYQVGVLQARSDHR
ncbi:hypothetical protein [Cryptosporangium sp. NPDC051539]|uniref:hypothetical protein n=1 Tax=Cryptosporangium sp. NPDC051539 TaxID=3363962 RepID=UPI0037A17E47